ncbi:ECF transporter S component [Ureibacillus chungkukjangi]|uniref:Putative membrane protein n=1 Tax=Ureibacillus chungkukjangi TaxID=1202712 RepID=A0A318TUC1_9BACL|nr:ECF transporter S component [Ureibacillus chungkukjangi]MCM3387625.1 ECF transporter S component [Ureibacillus chungkukjangi]PYF07943.1 putative membrane protein [Ureibacillus chungkukjangi]HCG4535987.1 ECF transporter S component [Salmonella enterica subsp. enterica serovar Typhi str. AG3]
MQKTLDYSSSRNKTFDLIISALLISLVFVSTVFLNIKLPIGGQGGLVHLGTGMLFIASIMFGPKKGALAGSLGMGLFDLMSGWTIWAPGTIIARGLQGYIVGKIAWSKGRNGNSIGFNLFGMMVSIPVMVVVYYLYESIIFGNWIIPLGSIPGNLVQNAVGMVIAIPVCLVLKKTPLFK